MESNLEPSSTEKYADGSSKDGPNTNVEDDDSKIEIEFQVSSTEIDNVEDDIEDRSTSINDTVEEVKKDEAPCTEENVDDVVDNKEPCSKKDEAPCTEEKVDDVVNNEEPCLKKTEASCTEENVLEEHKESSSTEAKNPEKLEESEETIHPRDEKEKEELSEDSSMDSNMLVVEEDVPALTNKNGVSKALKRPFEQTEDQSSSEGSDGGSGDENESNDSDEDEVSEVEKVKESLSKTYPSSKRRKIECKPIEINFNEAYQNQDFIKSLSSAFCSKTKMKFENGASILSEPFTCCVLPDFIGSEEFINKLKAEVEEIEVEAKMNDLYKFKQSVDLADYPSSEIQAIYNLLNEKCVKWLSEVTNIPLTDKIDMFCSCYTYTDHLLCHDDELEGRRIAYIYYLTPPNWEKKDGGLLDLFNSEDGEPSQIVHSFVPTCDNFIFFEVGPTSYHQVSEVLAYKTRTALSGWFYGPPLERTIHSSELVLFQAPTYCTVDIRDWVNPIYLKPDTQLHIRQSFEESSEMELMDFFQNAKYEMVCQALNEKGISWRNIGPPNRRKYEELDESDLPPILKECQNLFCCEPFFLVLSNLTGLRLHPLCSENDVKMGEVNSSIRKWSQGYYSLLHEHSFFKFATLNAALCFNCPDWDSECGGYTSYVAKNIKDELLRVDPKPNSLALVYITKKTSFFVKYINSHVTERSTPFFQDIFTVYREIE